MNDAALSRPQTRRRGARTAATVAVAALTLFAATAATAVAAPLTPATMREDAKAAQAPASPILRAVAAGNAEELKTALAAVDAAPLLDAPDARGRTPLMIAAGLGRADLVTPLLDKGAGVDKRDGDGRTALHYALGGARRVPQARSRVEAAGTDAQVAGMRAARTIERMRGLERALVFLAPGGPGAQRIARDAVRNRNLWGNAVGAAILAREGDPAILVAELVRAPEADDVKRGRIVVATLADTVKGGGKETLRRLWPAFDAPRDDENAARWQNFLRLIERGKTRDAERLTMDPDHRALIEEAAEQLRAAALLLPGRDKGAAAVSALLARGADPAAADSEGVTPARLAPDAGLDAALTARLTGRDKPAAAQPPAAP